MLGGREGLDVWYVCVCVCWRDLAIVKKVRLWVGDVRNGIWNWDLGRGAGGGFYTSILSLSHMLGKKFFGFGKMSHSPSPRTCVECNGGRSAVPRVESLGGKIGLLLNYGRESRDAGNGKKKNSYISPF